MTRITPSPSPTDTPIRRLALAIGIAALASLLALLAVSAESVAPPEPIATMAPTPTPAPPPPTPIPPTPTLPPGSTSVQTSAPTETATSIATAIPTETATATAEPTESAAATATSTATAGPTATATVTEPSAPPIAPDTLECLPLTSSQVGDAWYFETTCTAGINSTRTATRIRAEVADGWTIQLRPPAGDWGGSGFTEQRSVEAGASFTFDVRIVAPTTAPGGRTANVIISMNIDGTPDDATPPGIDLSLTAQIPQPAAPAARMTTQSAPAPLQCSGPTSTEAHDVVVYDCSYDIDFDGSANADVTLTATIGNGWDVGLVLDIRTGEAKISESPLNNDGTAEVKYSRGGGSAHTESGTVQIFVRASAKSHPGDSATLSITHTCAQPFKGFCGTLPTVTLQPVVPTQQCADLTDPGVSAALTDVSLSPLPYDHAPRTNSGTATLTVANPRGCTGWAVDISATDLEYAGTAPGGVAIPVGNLSLAGDGITAVTLSGEAQRLISGGGAESSYEWELTVRLAIPSGSLAGSYTSTVTVNTTSAP